MKLFYCPECASKLTKKSDSLYVCEKGHPFWNNPKATVTIVLLKGDQALFAKRAVEPHKGKYDLPGGFVDYGESAWQAIARELKEETGLTAANPRFVYNSGQSYAENTSCCDFIFVCTEWEGDIQAQDDVAALEWKPIDFIDGPDFAWPYPGLAETLRHLL